MVLSIKKVTLGVGESFQIKASVIPENALSKSLTYKASNNKVSVSASGKVKAKKTGTCQVTVQAANGKKAVITVVVKKAPKKITIKVKNKKLKVGKKVQIKIKLPKNTASNKITYSSSKKSVASVSASGKITAKKRGKTTITAKTFNGKKAKIKITVK